MNGLPRFTLNDDGAGFKGKRITGPDGQPSDLLRSTDKHFRPADPQIGPDGALWFGDWANPLIGHMQYSQRDPNRDHVHGRIYRLFGTEQKPVTPVTQHGKSIPEVLEQFREYEWRTRYRARRELRGERPTAEVLPAVQQWVSRLDPNDPIYDRLRCEALWIQQGHHAVDLNLLKSVLQAKTPQARAAAVRIVADERDYLPGVLDLLKPMVNDDHPRVRTEALRGLSFFSTPEAMAAALETTKHPLDYWTKYTLEHTLGANEAVWRQGFLTGTIAQGNKTAQEIMTGVLATSRAGGVAAPFLRTLLSTEPTSAEEKNKAMTALAMQKGNPSNGRAVFQRNCIACHKVGNGEGQEYGPNLQGVATRQKTRYKLVESIIDPNAEMDPKYYTTKIDTLDGKTISGLLVAEDKKAVTIFDGKDKQVIPLDDIETRTVLKQSSMPEGQAATMAPSEFLDLIEYLATLKE
jgi:putative heme-binding domain-containing protein